MPGEDLSDALRACEELSRTGLGTVLTSLGERITSIDEATAVRVHYLSVLDTIVERKLPTQISVKLTHLGLSIDRKACIESVLALARRVPAGEIVWIDMEESPYVDATLDVFRSVRAETENVGVCLQSYLRRTTADVNALLPLSPAIRLVKGAYREPPEIAFPKKADTDRAYLDISLLLLEHAAAGRATLVSGTHDPELLEQIRARAEALRVASPRWEVHMLYGIKSDEQSRLAARGVGVRTLISYGANWFPWYVRRLAERPANVWFIVRNLW